MQTIGQVSLASESDGQAHVYGWACLADGSPVDSLLIALSGYDDPIPLNYRLGLPVKGEVARYLPMDGPMRRAGFEITVSDEWSDLMQGRRLQITPQANGQDGEPIEWVCSPRLPLPGDSLIDLVGGGGREAFFRVGFEFLGHFIHKAGLTPDSRVLDVGCGVGRIAYALAHYLGSDAAYEGFDLCQESIAWANREIGGFRSTFRFERIDLQHDLYNPEGAIHPSDFRFPYENDAFDFVFLTSVFTHMSATEVRSYLAEIRRVLQPGGSCFLTAFLLDADSEELAKQGKGHQFFPHQWGEGFTTDPERPESAVAFSDEKMMEWLKQSGLELKKRFPGYWSGRPCGFSYQDLLIAS